MAEKEKSESYQLVEVPTQMGIAIKSPEGEIMNEAQLLVTIANDIAEIKKNLLGK